MSTPRRFLFLTSALLLLAAPLAAQKRTAKPEQTVPDLLKAANAAFDAKEYGTTVSALQEALRLVQQKQRAALVDALPKPAGWEIEDQKQDEMNAAFAGLAALGSAVTRKYTKGDQSINIEIFANSPTAQMVGMMFSNPVLLQAQGGEVVEYGVHKALLKKEGDSYEMQLLMHGKHLITVRTNGVSDKDLFAIIDQKSVDALDKQLGK